MRYESDSGVITWSISCVRRSVVILMEIRGLNNSSNIGGDPGLEQQKVILMEIRGLNNHLCV